MGTATAQNQQVENRPIKSRVWNAVTIATAKTVKMMICTTVYKHSVSKQQTILVCPSVVQIMLQAMNHMPNKWSLPKLVSFRGRVAWNILPCLSRCWRMYCMLITVQSGCFNYNYAYFITVQYTFNPSKVLAMASMHISALSDHRSKFVTTQE